MPTRSRFGVSLEQTLLRAFDQWRARKGFASRSQAIARLISEGLAHNPSVPTTGQVIGVVTLLYDPAHHVLSHTLTRTQHTYHSQIVSSQHIHLDEHDCLEVVVLKGSAKQVQEVADRLRSLKGVKHGQVVMTAGRVHG